MLSATYGESVISTPMYDNGEPSGPMLNGTTYIVRPRIAPRNRRSSVSRISAGSRQLLVGPASISRSEQMKVRSSTRATSLGSVWAQNELGRFSGSRATKVPASTSCALSSARSCSDPSNQCTEAGSSNSVISSTQSSRRWCFVGASTNRVYRRPFRCSEPCVARAGGPGMRSDLGAREAHVGLGADAHGRGAAVAVELEGDALPLSQHAEDRALERVGGEHELGAIGVAHDDALAGLRVVDADDALHAGWSYGFCTLPALRQAMQTWTRRGVPFTTARMRCTLGFQRRLVRRCEWLIRMPNCGFLPQMSQTDAMSEDLELGGTDGGYQPRSTIPSRGGPARAGTIGPASHRRHLPRRAARAPGRAQPPQRVS